MFKKMSALILSTVAMTIAAAPSAMAAEGVPDTPFVQEYHEPYAVGEDAGMNDVRSVAVDGGGHVWAATRAGAYVLKKGETSWAGGMEKDNAGPTYAAVADRTGTVCAVYRVAVDGWTKEEAIREMREGGFGFHEVWKNLPRWIEGLDVEGRSARRLR